jgi:effector-binding domain-containing protein
MRASRFDQGWRFFMSAPTVALEQPVLTSAPRRFVLFRHRVVAQAELGPTIRDTFGELYSCVEQSGANPGGPPFVIYHNLPQQGAHWEIDICAPVAAPMVAPPCFEYIEMPSCIVASLLHVGPYDTLGEAYGRLEAFITERGLQPAGPPREFYYSEPNVPPSETRTLIERPVNEP